MVKPDATSPIAPMHADASEDVTAPLDDAVVLDHPAYRVGDLVARRYRIDRLLARGGMADVYAATDLGLRREVALKVASGDSTAASVASERLLREAKTLASLHHPNIIAVQDKGRTLRGAAFIALERVNGSTLRQLLEQNEPLTAQTATALAMQIASGLAAAHARGIVHCDLSPSNVLLSRSEGGALSCKLIDFGAACRVGKSRNAPLHDAHRYMAPEGLAGGEADTQLDLYALGVILADMLESAAAGAPPALTALSNSLRTADPRLRPSASAVLATLRQIAAGNAPAVTLNRRPIVPTPSRLAWSVVGTAVLVSAGALISAVGASRARSNAVAVTEPRSPPPPVRATLQEFPVHLAVAMPELVLEEARPRALARSGPAVQKQAAIRPEPRRDLEAALLERRKQMFQLGLETARVVAVASISFDPRQRSARVAYRRENVSDELVEYWALRDGRWQPVMD